MCVVCNTTSEWINAVHPMQDMLQELQENKEVSEQCMASLKKVSGSVQMEQSFGGMQRVTSQVHKFIVGQSAFIASSHSRKNTGDFISHIHKVKSTEPGTLYKQTVLALMRAYLSPIYVAFRHNRHMAHNIIKYVEDGWDPLFVVAHEWYNNEQSLKDDGLMRRMLAFLCAMKYNSGGINVDTPSDL